jgi:hypothetical protein
MLNRQLTRLIASGLTACLLMLAAACDASLPTDPAATDAEHLTEAGLRGGRDGEPVRIARETEEQDRPSRKPWKADK